MTVVSNLQNSTNGKLAELSTLIREQPILQSCFTVLPEESYHTTLLAINCQFKYGPKGLILNDEEYAKILEDKKWENVSKKISSANYVPKLRPKRCRINEGIVLIELEPDDKDTPTHPSQIPLFQEIANELGISLQKPTWHLTLAYCYKPDIFNSADKILLDKECSKIEAIVESINGLCFEPGRLCRYEDMSNFVPWDGCKNDPCDDDI